MDDNNVLYPPIKETAEHLRRKKGVSAGVVRMREFINPVEFSFYLDTVESIGWHNNTPNYYVHHDNNVPENIIIVTRSGSGVLEFDSVLYPLRTGTLTVIPAFAESAYWTDPEEDHWDFYWMHLKGVNADNMLQYLFKRNVYNVPVNADLLCGIIESILSSTEIGIEQTLQNAQSISIFLNQLFKMICTSDNNISDNSSVIKTALQFIEENYQNHISVEDIARQVFLSNEYLIRSFKAQTGYTPYAYLKKVRLMKACELLSNTEESVKEIAASVGFASYCNFIMSFREQKGMTPLQYRQSRR